jgi:hypothetical protein
VISPCDKNPWLRDGSLPERVTDCFLHGAYFSIPLCLHRHHARFGLHSSYYTFISALLLPGNMAIPGSLFCPSLLPPQSRLLEPLLTRPRRNQVLIFIHVKVFFFFIRIIAQGKINRCPEHSPPSPMQIPWLGAHIVCLFD